MLWLLIRTKCVQAAAAPAVQVTAPNAMVEAIRLRLMSSRPRSAEVVDSTSTLNRDSAVATTAVQMFEDFSNESAMSTCEDVQVNSTEVFLMEDSVRSQEVEENAMAAMDKDGLDQAVGGQVVGNLEEEPDIGVETGPAVLVLERPAADLVGFVGPPKGRFNFPTSQMPLLEFYYCLLSLT